jgi:hypothetical protein
VLCLCARVEAHDEVVAIVVCCALLASGFGEEEGAPVCDAADDAAGCEDLIACCASDSGGCVLGVCEGGVVCVEGVLFDLVDAAAGTDLGNVLVGEDVPKSALRLTTPINSYNMADVDCWCLRAACVAALP